MKTELHIYICKNTHQKSSDEIQRIEEKERIMEGKTLREERRKDRKMRKEAETDRRPERRK